MSAELRALKGAGSFRQSTAPMTATADERAAHCVLRNHGKRFAALSELWVKRSAFGHPCPEYLETLGPWPPERLANRGAWEEGIIAELYFFLPQSCHDQIEGSPTFVRMVRQLSSPIIYI